MRSMLKKLKNTRFFQGLRRLIPNQVVNWLWHLPTAVLAVAFYRYPAKNLKVIGVTGTDGKTTTASIIADILQAAGKKVALITTVSAKIGGEEVSTGLHVTSPNPWKLQYFLRKIADKGYDFAVLEITSHGLDQFRSFGCNFQVGVVTNVTHEHLDYHKTWENYLQAKAKLFKNVDYKVLNKDDKSFSYLQQTGEGQIISYSLDKKANLQIKNLEFNENGMEFRYLYQDKFGTKEDQKIKTNLCGRFNVSNILGAVGAVKTYGIDKKMIAKALKGFKGVVGRMEEIESDHDFQVVVDFAHTPNGLKNALKALKKIYQPERLIAVFGCAGLRDKDKRPKMGAIACELADTVVLTAEDPRTEEVEEINQEILAGCDHKDKVIEKEDRREAIEFVINELGKKGDVIGIFGKGHEESMCLGTVEYPWSDIKVVKKILKKNE
jgi:UDP-N-acetylmuramoyl-L-alanyl-D-glutamate--2,6-diaminopimelate ligase